MEMESVRRIFMSKYIATDEFKNQKQGSLGINERLK